MYSRFTLSPVARLCPTTGTISLITWVKDLRSAKVSGIPYWHSYCIDHQKAYYQGRKIEDVDLESFRSLPIYDFYAYDKN